MYPPLSAGVASILAVAPARVAGLSPILAAGLWSVRFPPPARMRLPTLYVATWMMGDLSTRCSAASSGSEVGAALAALILGSANWLGLSPPAWLAYLTVGALGSLQGASAAGDLIYALPQVMSAGIPASALDVLADRTGATSLSRGLGGLIALSGLAAFALAARS